MTDHTDAAQRALEKGFRFHGPMGRGFMRTLRYLKRSDAEQRNANTTPDRRSKKGKKS